MINIWVCTQNGLIVNFMNIFHGVIDTNHLWAPLTTKEWQARATVGDTLLARIVYVDHGTKSIHLSLRPHVVEFRAPKELPALGMNFILQYVFSLIINRIGLYCIVVCVCWIMKARHCRI